MIRRIGKITISAIILTFFFTLSAFSDEFEVLIKDALRQSPSEYKRTTRSGKRLLQEKIIRIKQIDGDIAGVFNRRDYNQGERLLKEALKLTIEYYGTIDNLAVVERFSSLGILYMQAGYPYKAEQCFSWGINIGEDILGENAFQLANLYRFIIAAYYEQAKYSLAMNKAIDLLAIYVSETGPDSNESREIRDLIHQIKSHN